MTNQDFKSGMKKLAMDCADGAEDARKTWRKFAWMNFTASFFYCAAGVYFASQHEWLQVSFFLGFALWFFASGLRNLRDGCKYQAQWLHKRQECLDEITKSR